MCVLWLCTIYAKASSGSVIVIGLENDQFVGDRDCVDRTCRARGRTKLNAWYEAIPRESPRAAAAAFFPTAAASLYASASAILSLGLLTKRPDLSSAWNWAS